MAEIREYILVDEHGDDDGTSHRDIDVVRRIAKGLGTRHAIVAQVYELTHEECIEMPEGAQEWPPTEEAQERSARCWIAT